MVLEYFRAQLLLPDTATPGRPIAAEIANLTALREAGQFRQRSGKNGFVP